MNCSLAIRLKTANKEDLARDYTLKRLELTYLPGVEGSGSRTISGSEID